MPQLTSADHASEATARTLTLIAKIVQNLANMSEFGQKEDYMQCCNDFLVATRPRMQDFLDRLAVRIGSSHVPTPPPPARTSRPTHFPVVFP